MDRRNFIRTVSVASAGAAMLQAQQALSQPSTIDGIIYRTLGRTGFKVPVISMGVVYTDPGVIRAAWDAGIRHYDCAFVYSGGRSEELLGNFLTDYPRDSYVLATKGKGDGVSGGAGLEFKEYSVRDFVNNFHTSLKRLKVDYVDIFYYHEVMTREGILFEPYLKAMEQFKKDGKVRYLGVSAHGNEPVVLRSMIESRFYDVALISVNYQQKHYEEVKKAVGEATASGMGIVAMKTMAGGYADKERKIPVDAKAALKFVLNDENVHTIILGFKTYDEVGVAMSVMKDLTLHQEDIKKLDWLRSQGSLYCLGCGQCTHTCNRNFPIPDIMRSYMYSYGYQKPKNAFEIIRKMRLPENPYGDCTICPVKCTQHFNVKEKISDIARLSRVPQEFLS